MIEKVIRENTHIHTVSEITSYIKGNLEEDTRLQNILIKGEISNYRIPGRHLYFSLKDGDSLLSCIMFEDKLQELKFDLTNGLEVVVRGSIGVYAPQGRYQLYVEEMFPMGKGFLYLTFEKLKNDLKKKGYFDPEHKKALCFLPQRIGVVTSPKGAAIKDILRVLDDRFPNLEIILSPCRVQGKEAPLEIARAIENLNEYGKIDVIIVGRGGGSMEDLFAFNDQLVADAIYNSSIPIISAVGHEIDQTIADLVADARAPTPSGAAQMVIPRKEDLLLKVLDKRRKIKTLINQRKDYFRGEVSKLEKLLVARHPRRIVQNLKQRVDELRRQVRDYLNSGIHRRRNLLLRLRQNFVKHSPQHQVNLIKERLKPMRKKLIQAISRDIERKKGELTHLKNKNKALSPYSILKRGYSITFGLSDGKIIKEYTQVRQGEKIKVKLHKGYLYADILKTEEEEEG